MTLYRSHARREVLLHSGGERRARPQVPELELAVVAACWDMRSSAVWPKRLFRIRRTRPDTPGIPVVPSGDPRLIVVSVPGLLNFELRLSAQDSYRAIRDGRNNRAARPANAVLVGTSAKALTETMSVD